jgi:hypothetical protein
LESFWRQRISHYKDGNLRQRGVLRVQNKNTTIHKQMKLSSVLLALSIVLSMFGGYSDITGNRIFGMSREHYWSDAIYVAVLAIGIHLLWHK